MIDPALRAAALQSIHFMTVHARAWAYDEEPHKRIASLLDDTEYLIEMLFRPDECTEEFLGYLEESAKNHHCLHAYTLLEQQLEPLKANPS